MLVNGACVLSAESALKVLVLPMKHLHRGGVLDRWRVVVVIDMFIGSPLGTEKLPDFSGSGARGIRPGHP